MTLAPATLRLLDAIARALAEQDLKAILAEQGGDLVAGKGGELPAAPAGPSSSEKQTPGTEGERG